MADLKLLAKEWIDKADHDLKIAQEDFGKPERVDVVAFYSQQAAEKYLKAFLVFKKSSFPKIHDIDELLNRCSKISNEFEKFKRSATILAPLYVGARYPFMGIITIYDVEKAVKAAKEIGVFVKEQLKL